VALSSFWLVGKFVSDLIYVPFTPATIGNVGLGPFEITAINLEHEAAIRTRDQYRLNLEDAMPHCRHDRLSGANLGRPSGVCSG
jgi:hypothetical protein